MRVRFATTTLFIFLALAVSNAALAQRPGGGPPGGGGPGFPGGPGGPGGPVRGPGVPGRPRDPAGPPPGGQPPRDGIELPREPRPPRPLGPQADFLSSEMRYGDRTVKGSPYSAQFITEATQVLADGTRITRTSNGLVYRNTEGRTRREQKLTALGPIPIEGQPKQLIFINDPVAGAHYVLDVQEQSARKLPFHDLPPGDFAPGRQGPADPQKIEALGEQMIEGVRTEGTRSTVTIPTGRIGNDRPLKIVSERWYSPELQIVVLSKHSDPFSGENVYRLKAITRDEPSASLFVVPADYRVIEERHLPRNPRQ